MRPYRYSGVLTKDGKQRHAPISNDKGKSKSAEPDVPATTAPKPRVMNYAAAAAKADTSKKVAPPGFGAKGSAATPTEPKQADKPASVTPDKKKDKDLEGKFISYRRSISDFRVVKTILFTRVEKLA